MIVLLASLVSASLIWARTSSVSMARAEAGATTSAKAAAAKAAVAKAATSFLDMLRLCFFMVVLLLVPSHSVHGFKG